MAKPKITILEKLCEDSFTHDNETLSHKRVAGQCESDDTKGDADSQTSGILNPVKEDFLQADSHHSCESEVIDIINTTEVEENQKDIADRKFDYETESFYSYDSYKGSEMTNVTPRSSLSECSSLLHSAGMKYAGQKLNMIDGRNIGNQHKNIDGEELSLLAHEMKCLREKRQAVMPESQRTPNGRRNMSFSNEELRKIEKDNQLLLKKIMSHQKPQVRTTKPVSGPPRTSSSAINRRKQQKKIEEDNMMLLRRIQSAKSCAIPRGTPSGCRLRM
ncbi:cilia- and flagella-associated protein 97 [Athalia rosae]|uniref:cilia- and flagella-associated protein 97 n=1 Tax=Athalia rosae TaxID=37344 RepID=UPI0020332E33|nr:cilia- and flagella-associated protein 97 [Athalia rosae]